MYFLKDYMGADEQSPGIHEVIRALRLAFVTVSISPFLAGSVLKLTDFNFFTFILGCIAAVSTHLGANLINDYADSKTGVDWQDKRFYKFFGGSKLIQEGTFSEKFYLRLSISFFCLATLSVVSLAVILKSISILWFFAIILFLGFSYSYKPFYFSYNYLGEAVLFVLFGPALVMGGYFIQTGIFPNLESLLLFLPFGFYTTAILFTGEVPDFIQVRQSKKETG